MKTAGYTPTETGSVVRLPTALLIPLLPGMGCFSQWLRLRGVTSRVARGVVAGGCVALAGVAMMLLSQSSGAWEQIPLVIVAFSIAGVTNILGPPAIGEISPVHQRGAMLGISNAVFTLAGFAAPWVMGHIIDAGVNPAAGFRKGFLFGGALVAIGGGIAMILVNPEADLARFAEQKRLLEPVTLPVRRDGPA
jgi:MFS family permease